MWAAVKGRATARRASGRTNRAGARVSENPDSAVSSRSNFYKGGLPDDAAPKALGVSVILHPGP